jgi:arabinofuranan 3-O-arabinosyltransferase
MAAFWFSSLAVGGATFLVLAILSPHLRSGGLAAVSAVLGLSYVIAVPPGAIQLRATAAAGADGPDLALRPPRLLFIGALGLLAISPLLAHALKIPVAALVLGAVQLPLSSALGSVRGSFIGHRDHRRASGSFGIDASCRLAAGVGLGLLWGATGVAAALVIATAVPLLTLRPPADTTRSSAAGGSSAGFMIAVSVITVLTNIDVLLAPRVLGHEADSYAAAALPAKGIYFAIVAVSWLAVAATLQETRRLRLMLPVAGTLALGVLGAAVLVAARPLLPALLHHGEPALDVLGPLALAMAISGAAAVAVSMAVARGAPRAWVPACVAVVALAAAAVVLSPDKAELATGVLFAQLIGLAGGVHALLRRPGEIVSGASEPSDAPARFGVSGSTRPQSLPAARLASWWRTRRARASSADPGAVSEAGPQFPTLALAGVSLLVFVACMVQAPGHIIADTKLDLYVDPGRFMARSLNLWDSSSSFGQVQNQAVGYLFPMGPFFALARLIGIPVWIAQRLWLAVLVSLGTWGTARMAAALRIGSPTGWVVGGLIYGLSPFVVGQLASTSAGVIPAALAPWVVLPLINAGRTGSLRRAAGRSGLAVLAMGGVNAASTLCVLLLPALYLITRHRSPARRTLSLWWVGSVILACVWWGVALLYQGHSGLDFIRFTETPATTQSTTSALEVLRGTPDWLSYLHLGFAWIPAGWSLATSPIAVLATVGLAAAGMAGLCRAGLPERRFLVMAFAIGVLCVGMGYVGPASGVAGSVVQSLLRGSLAAFRNTAKFEPVVTLPLALATIYMLGAVDGGRLRAVAAAGVLMLVLGSALPFWQGTLVARGSFTAVPTYWHRLADYMHSHAADSTTLLIPSSAFAEYDWGRPMDEPLESLATTPWAVRDLLPLGGIASTQMLDAIENQVVDGRVTPRLTQVLSRAGIRYVVARNDLNWQLADSPPPVQVNAALRAAGLRRVASFGPSVPAAAGLAALKARGASARVPALEVYAVPGGASLVHAYPQRDAVVLSGGPQSLPQMAAARQLRRRAVLLAQDVPGGELHAGDRWVVSDASRRDGQNFGLAESNVSYTLAPDEQVAGGSDLQVVPPVSGAQQAVARYHGEIDAVSASSYGSWLLQLPELAPNNAFDGNPDTAWVAGTVGTSVGQWVQADLAHPVGVSHVDVQLLEDGPWRPLVHRLTVTTQQGSLTTAVTPNQTTQTLPTRPGTTRFVRITFTSVSGETRGGATAGLRDVKIPGVHRAIRYVQPPEEPALLKSSAATGITPSFDFTRQTANPSDLLRRDPEAQLARVIELPAAASMRIRATVTPTPGTALDRLLNRSRGLTVNASSSWNDEPRYRPANAVDGSRKTSWVAAPPTALPADNPSAPGITGPATVNQPQHVSPVPAVADAHPSLRLSWRHARTLAAVKVRPAGGFAAAPTELRITSAAGTRTVKVAPHDRVAHFAPLHTDRVTVTFPEIAARFTTSADGTRVRLPVGVAALDFPALRSLQEIPLAPAFKLRIGCRQSPSVFIDGRRVRLRVNTTAGAIVDESALPVLLCGPRQTVSLGSGTHWISSPAGHAFTLTTLTMTPSSLAAPVAPARRAVRVVHWGADSREVRLAAGAAAYLAVRENDNSGWEATMNGKRLTPVRLDGWEQGWAVPAGAAAVIHLVYGPNHGFQVGLIVGAVLVGLLILLTLAPGRGRRPGIAELLIPAGPVGRRTGWAMAALAVMAVALLCWPVLPALVLLILLARLRPGLLAWVAAATLVAAGVVVALNVVPYPSEHLGAFGVPAEILTGIAFATVMAAQVRRPVTLGENAETDR